MIFHLDAGEKLIVVTNFGVVSINHKTLDTLRIKVEADEIVDSCEAYQPRERLSEVIIHGPV